MAPECSDPRPSVALTADCYILPTAALRSGPVAQWLEPTAHNGLVAGSSPAGPTTFSLAILNFSAGGILADHRFDHRNVFLRWPAAKGVGRFPQVIGMVV